MLAPLWRIDLLSTVLTKSHTNITTECTVVYSIIVTRRQHN